MTVTHACGCVSGGAGGVERGHVPDAARLPRPAAPERRGRDAPVRAVPPRRRHRQCGAHPGVACAVSLALPIYICIYIDI